MADAAKGSGALDGLSVGDNLLAKPRLESVRQLAALTGRTRRVRLRTARVASFRLGRSIVSAGDFGASGIPEARKEPRVCDETRKTPEPLAVPGNCFCAA